eukprot:g17246.t1
MVLRGAQPVANTLPELLEISGVCDHVVSFLHAREVGQLCCSCKRLCKALTVGESGKLRCVNLVLSFKCRLDEDEDEDETADPVRLTAVQRSDMGALYSRVDTNQIERLHVVLQSPGETIIRHPVVKVGPVLAAIHSFLGPKLVSLSLGSGLPHSFAVEGLLTRLKIAEENELAHFLIAVARLPQLQSLHVPANLLTYEMRSPLLGAPMTLAKLERLHCLSSVLDLDAEMTTRSFGYVCFVVGRRAKGVKNQLRDVCVALQSCAFAAESDRVAGQEFWEAILTPSVELFDISLMNRDTDLWAADRIWSGATGVAQLAVDHLPPIALLRQRVPNSKRLLVAWKSIAEEQTNNCNSEFLAFLDGFAAEYLAFYRSEFTAFEVGVLTARLQDERFMPALVPRCRAALRKAVKEAAAEEVTDVLDLTTAASCLLPC